MIYPAVFLTGLGGLLIEIVLVRRYGLALGNTSEASAAVISVYMLGLGVGGLLVAPALRRIRSPLAAASILYAAVAAVSVLLDAALRRAGALSPGVAVVWLALQPGLATVLMGMAFPMIFTALGAGERRGRVGALIGANLAGSLVGTAIGSNLLITRFGLTRSLLLGTGAYLVAAALLVTVRRVGASERVARPAVPPIGRMAVSAAVAGALVLGLQVFLLRRLPFHLQGFQPTLTGVIAACLLGLTLGSAVGPGLLARAFAARAVPAAILLGALTMNLGLHEHLVAPLSRITIASEFGIHARVWLCAIAAAGLPCFFLGAVVPLCVSRFDEPRLRSVVTGRLFFWQGVGSVVGSLAVAHLLPRIFPTAYFACTPLVLGLASVGFVAPQIGLRTTAAFAVSVIALAATGISGLGTPWSPEPPLRSLGFQAPGSVRYLAHRTDSTTTASVVYDRSSHSIELYTDRFRATETGRETGYMRVLGHLAFLLRPGLDDVAVIAFGTGTTARAVTQWPDPKHIHLVEISPAVLSLAGYFDADGPVSDPGAPRFLDDPRVEVHVTDGRRFLALREPGSLDLITMEPLLPYAPGTVPLYTREFYELARDRLTPDGLLMQWIPTHAMPREYFETLLRTFAESFAYTSVWLVDRATLVIGSRSPHIPEPGAIERRLEEAPREARLSMHEAGLADADDFLAAFIGDDVLAVTRGAQTLRDDRPFIERIGMWMYRVNEIVEQYPANLLVLSDLASTGSPGPLSGPSWTRMRLDRLAGLRALARASYPSPQRMKNAQGAADALASARRILPDSVLLHQEETRALRLLTELEVVRRGGREVGPLVIRQLARDAGSPLLWASLALGGAPDTPISPDRAGALAVAVDPLFFQRAPPFLRPFSPPPGARRSPLEQIERIPQGPALAAAAAGDDAQGVALRSAYPVRSARALIDVLAERPLTASEATALASLVDPVLAAQAAEAVAERGGDPSEVANLRRPDLPPVPTR